MAKVNHINEGGCRHGNSMQLTAVGQARQMRWSAHRYTAETRCFWCQSRFDWLQAKVGGRYDQPKRYSNFYPA